MKTVILLVLTVVTLSSCKNSTQLIESSTKPSIEKEKQQIEYLNSELKIITNLEKGLEKALAEKKPILLYFTGYSLTNRQKINSELLIENQTVFKILKRHYINIWLYVDDKDVGNKWSNYQKNNFKSNVQPYFVILDSNGNPISKGMNYLKAKTNLETELLKNK